MGKPADPWAQPTRRMVLAGVATGLLWPGLGRGQSAPEGGIGGTGIVGTLSGAGGLSVNGRRLLISARTRIEDATGRIPASSLRAGDSVTIEALGQQDGSLRARRVALTIPLIGQATGRGGSLRVNGVRVTGPRSVLARATGRVAVHGLWRGDQVVASRIVPAPEGPDVMAGALRADGTLGGVAPNFGRRNAPPADRFATLIGRGGAEGFTVARTERERFKSPGRLRFLSVEGYLEPTTAAPGYIVSGLGHSFDRAARLAAIAGPRALIDGPYTGDFQAERGLILPESPSARLAVLQDRLAGGAPGLRLR